MSVRVVCLSVCTQEGLFHYPPSQAESERDVGVERTAGVKLTVAGGLLTLTVTVLLHGKRHWVVEEGEGAGGGKGGRRVGVWQEVLDGLS